MSVDELKSQGNKAFAAKNYNDAIDLFSQALALDPSNHVLYSNRSAAHAGNKEWDAALEDAEKCINANPAWAKAYARKGAALHGLRKWDDAIAAYEQGIKIEDSQALRKGLEEVKEAKETASMSGADKGLGKIFSDPNMISKIANNPKTAKYLADPAFMNTLKAIQTNPQLASGAFQDPRMIEVMGVLMGIDLNAFSRPEGSGGFGAEDAGSSPFASQTKPASPPSSAGPSSTPTPAPAASSSKQENEEEMPGEEPMEEDEDADAAEEKKAKAAAEEQKKLGSEAYRKRDFDAAATAFAKAWDFWPKDITFLTNLSAVQFEQGNYTECISTCEKAIDEGRSLRADFKLIAKALGRIGSSYQRLNDLPSAIRYFNKSLTEHRTPDILNKLRDAEKELKIKQEREYIDPVKAEAEREEGNKLFKNGDFAGALKHYTEAIRRNPEEAKTYNNRSLCYTRLVALPEALKDAEKAIEVDPNFVKAYIRKSAVLFSMREYTKAIEAIQHAAEKDTTGEHMRDIQQQMIKCNEALSAQRAGETEEQVLERAMKDPEIQKIMGDPVMQSILQQAQSDPKALQDHMKNPAVRENIMKLANAGIIRTGPR